MTAFRSRYDRARFFWLMGVAVFLLGFGVFAAHDGAGLLIAAAGIGLAQVAVRTRCHSCRKSLMMTYAAESHAGWWRSEARKKWMPERVCSDCGFRLDGPQ